MTERTISAEEREEALEVARMVTAAPYLVPMNPGPSNRIASALLAEHDRNARLSAWVSGDVARARELAQQIADNHYTPLAAEIVALLTPKDAE